MYHFVTKQYFEKITYISFIADLADVIFRVTYPAPQSFYLMSYIFLNQVMTNKIQKLNSTYLFLTFLEKTDRYQSCFVNPYKYLCYEKYIKIR